MTEIDLRRFCATENRPEISAPFSVGEHTYATNGTILIRVPRRDDIPDRSGAPKLDRVLPKTPATQFRPVERVTIPTGKLEECGTCMGRGRLHSCPSCTCVCTRCAATGRIEEEACVRLGDQYINLPIARLLLALPGTIEVVDPMPAAGCMVEFRFEGGDGLLMLMYFDSGRVVPDVTL